MTRTVNRTQNFGINEVATNHDGPLKIDTGLIPGEGGYIQVAISNYENSTERQVRLKRVGNFIAENAGIDTEVAHLHDRKGRLCVFWWSRPIHTRTIRALYEAWTRENESVVWHFDVNDDFVRLPRPFLVDEGEAFEPRVTWVFDE